MVREHSPPYSILHFQFYKTKLSIMKRYSFFLVSLLFTTNSFAQLDKATWLVGGNGSFYSYNGAYTSASNSNTTKVNNIDIRASIGYFPIDKLVVGLRPSLYFNKGHFYVNGNSTGDISSNTQFLIGPFTRYYFLRKEKQFNLLADISYLVGTNSSPLTPNFKGSLREFNISAGVEIFFNSSCGVEFLVGYRNKYEDIKGTTGYTDKKNGFQVGIGFQLHLQK